MYHVHASDSSCDQTEVIQEKYDGLVSYIRVGFPGARSRVDEGLPREGGVRRSLHEEKLAKFLAQSDERETTAVSESVRFMSDRNTYGSWSEGKINRIIARKPRRAYPIQTHL